MTFLFYKCYKLGHNPWDNSLFGWKMNFVSPSPPHPQFNFALNPPKVAPNCQIDFLGGGAAGGGGGGGLEKEIILSHSLYQLGVFPLVSQGFMNSCFAKSSSYYLACQISSQHSYGKSEYFYCDFPNWLAIITQSKMSETQF